VTANKKADLQAEPVSEADAEFLSFINSTAHDPLPPLVPDVSVRGYKYAEEAINIVSPRAERRDEFLRNYDFAVQRIRDFAPAPSPSKREAEAKALANDIEAVLRRLDGLPQPLRHWIFKGSRYGRPADVEALEAMLAEARFHSAAPDKKGAQKGAPPQSQAREYAAREAQRLLLVFTDRKHPQGAKEKRFLSLAGWLYQEATGEKGDLTRYCKKVFNDRGTHGHE
jgi:hypothetical protein